MSGVEVSSADFEAAFGVRSSGIAYGDSYHDVGDMRGPGNENGAQGPGETLYLFDPSNHLIERRHH